MAEGKKKATGRGLILAIDLGGTKILSAVVNPYNKILSHAKRATPFDNPDKLTTEIIGCAEEALANAGVSDKDIMAIGMGSPGPLDPETGTVLHTGNIAIRNYPIGQILTKRFGVPVTLDNDVHMGCYGEFKAGAGKGTRNMVGLWIGTGVGGCVIRDGQVVLGANRNAGEIGHIIMDVKQRLKKNRRGTLETEASKTGMTDFIRRAIDKGKKTKLKKFVKGGKDRLKSGDLAKLFQKGDPVAVAAVEHSALYCGIAIANLFNILSPELFVIGGGVIVNLGDTYIQMVQKIANKYAYTTDLAPIKIAQAQLGDDSGVLGAAIAARDAL